MGLTGNGDWCPWCETSLERLITDTRMDLLHPAWLDVDHGPRYDELSDDDKLVWDAYRGNATGGGSRATWAARLGRAVKAGLITEAEAMGALRRSGVGDNPAA